MDPSPIRVAKTLELLGFDGFFGDRVFTASMVARGKPAPDLHLFAASQMSVAPQNVLVLEDSDTGVDAALSAGMQVWRYTGGSHFTAERKAQLKQTSVVPVFDSWANFYIDAPELMKRE